MSLIFITGNKSKFEEARSIIPNLQQLDIDLPEIQSLDPREVITAKLKEALKYTDECVVEDTSLMFDSLNGLPGPLIKWFLKAKGVDGLATLAERTLDTKATAVTWIGYQKQGLEPVFFEGALRGQIVQPRGDYGFGWDPIFELEEKNLTFAEMNAEEKNQVSMRKAAFGKLDDYFKHNPAE